jgi:NADPH2:quinone reductase
VVHAAAGGVGLLLCQLAKQRGARVLATVSTETKAQLARIAGAEETVLYGQQDFAQAVARWTEGRGVQVVYDSVGLATWERSLACLARRGMLVLFGQSSGPVPPIDPLLLARNGSVYLTRATLAHYVTSREELLSRAGMVLHSVARRELALRIEKTFPLQDAADAHRALESRATSGKLLLIPEPA